MAIARFLPIIVHTHLHQQNRACPSTMTMVVLNVSVLFLLMKHLSYASIESKP